MPSSKKSAAGCGNIRKKIIRRGGKENEYWEARYTVGFDPGTGKQVQKSVSGKTQKEVAQKLKAATAALDDGTYIAPNKMTVAQSVSRKRSCLYGRVRYTHHTPSTLPGIQIGGD